MIYVSGSASERSSVHAGGGEDERPKRRVCPFTIEFEAGASRLLAQIA